MSSGPAKRARSPVALAECCGHRHGSAGKSRTTHLDLYHLGSAPLDDDERIIRIDETLGVATCMGGGPSLMYAASAIAAFDEVLAPFLCMKAVGPTSGRVART